jgi:hypothetical protein
MNKRKRARPRAEVPDRPACSRKSLSTAWSAKGGVATIATMGDVGAVGPWRCPECDHPVAVRGDGKRTKKHFAHVAPPSTESESKEHLLAKKAMARTLDQWRFAEFCKQCRVPTGVVHEFPSRRRFKAFVEFTMDPWRLDVAVLEHEDVRAAIEVYYRHRVPRDKATDLEKRGVLVLEVSATHIINALDAPEVTTLPYKSLHKCETCVKTPVAKKQKKQSHTAQRREAVWRAVEVDSD